MSVSEGFGEYLDRLAGSGAMRVVHMVMNVVAATIGIFFLIIGITGVFDTYKDFGGLALPVTAIVLGTLVTMISLIGIIGSIKRSQHLFAAYSGLLTLLVLAQLVALLVIWLKPNDIDTRFGKVWEKLYENDPDTIRYIEKDLKCCGFKSPVDMPVPAHCSVKKHYGFTTGCLDILEHQWSAQKSTILWAGFAMVGAQIVSLLLGAELGRRYMNSQNEYQRVPQPARNEGSPLLHA
ncbi:hypothetical protein IW140_002597 [Coemansia sp. RSA 1813]|nr:hypothetical protein EV178_002075 [Coemansia sp. RSA 1646]KAJ1772704.1 hypothetical protein LPJ74_001230 [Coemansia sp. RSA 1843]KAJ2090655.1 hypothetical protein IW138_002469 [Coemansia sp. RSA 986]KAJ2216141.1 hypothetical protein EV179_001601 [Coemansia sp. RSA 487]KAJ2570127.1 hypothetical protein IW140_002597 [Coemansia sp. RSA 1813]